MTTGDTVTVDAEEYRRYKSAYEDAHSQYESAKYTDAQIEDIIEKRVEDERLAMEARYASMMYSRKRAENEMELEDRRSAYERLAGLPANMFREGVPDVSAEA